MINLQGIPQMGFTTFARKDCVNSIEISFDKVCPWFLSKIYKGSKTLKKIDNMVYLKIYSNIVYGLLTNYNKIYLFTGFH